MKQKENLKVLILIGLPASGKSSWAKKYLSTHDNYVRVSRDSFRDMLKNSDICEPKIEKMITDLVNNSVIKALSSKLNVIIDATNLKISGINEHIEAFGEYADIDYMFFDVPMNTCLERDRLRDKPVGDEVIKRMNKDFLILRDSFGFQPVKKRDRRVVVPNFVSDKPNVVIFDLDGTLAIMGNRSPYEFHKVQYDTLNTIVAEQVRYHKLLGRKIIIMSGRENSCLDLTIEWLEFHNIEYDHIFLKDKNDGRKDTVVKKEMYDNHIKDNFNVLAWYDDRLSVCRMIYKLGVFCYNVNQGLIEF